MAKSGLFQWWPWTFCCSCAQAAAGAGNPQEQPTVNCNRGPRQALTQACFPFSSFNLCCIVVVAFSATCCLWFVITATIQASPPPPNTHTHTHTDATISSTRWKLSARLLFISGFHFHFHFELQLRRKLHNLWAHPERWLGQGCEHKQAAEASRHHRYAFCIVALAIVRQSFSQSLSSSVVCSFTQPVSHSSVHPWSWTVSLSDRPAISGSILLRGLPLSSLSASLSLYRSPL